MSNKPFRRARLALALNITLAGLATTTVLGSAHAQAAQASAMHFNVPPGSLDDALNAFARQAGITLPFDPSMTRGKNSTGIKGSYTIQEGFARLLEGSGLEAVDGSKDGYRIRRITYRNPAKDTQLATIIVTGEKFSRSLQETTTAVSVFQGEDLDPTEARSLYEAIERVPNVANNIAELPTIRGVAGSGPTRGVFTFITGARPRVSTTVDGIAEGWSGQRYLDVGLWDTEQVEVLRGPQSTTQGRNTISGAIVVNTRDPSFKWESALRMGYENNDDKLALAGMVSGPLIKDELAFRLTAEGLVGDGYIDYHLPGGKQPSWDASEMDRRNYRGKLLWAPLAMPELTAKFTVAHRSQKGEYLNTIEDVDDGTCDQLSDYRFCGVTSNTRRGDSANTSYSADIQYELGQARTFHLFYGRSDYKAAFEQSDGNLTLHLDEISDTLETRMVWDAAGGRASGVLGLYYYQRSQNLNAGPDTFAGDDDVQTAALYGESTIKLGNRMGLILGGRLEREHQERDVLAWPTTPWEGHVLTDAAETLFLPKLGLTYRVGTDTNLGLTVRKGYTPGGGALDWNTSEYYEFGKEEVVAYEFSSRSTFMDGRATLNANLFHNRYDGFQTLLDYRIINVPKGVSQGLEVQSTARLSPSLEIHGGIGLLRTEVTDSGAANAAIKGNEFNYAPHFTASLGFRKKLAGGIFFGGDVSHTSEYYSEIDNVEADKAGGHTVVNLHAGYEAPRYTLRAYVKNLTDEEIIYHSSTNGSGQAVRIGQPRTIGVTLDYRF